MYSVCMALDNIEKTIRDKLAYAPPLGIKIGFDLGDDGMVFVDGTQNPAVVCREGVDADTMFVCSADVLENIINGTQDPTMAFMTGKLKVQGSMGHAMKLAALFE